MVKAKTVQGFDEDTAHGKGASAEGSGPEAIPTTEDLAKSFYQDESAEERRQLEAAINSQSQYLQQDPFSGSSMLSDDGYDDPELGTGVGLNFPDFFTNYLHLVQDTLRITIDDIEVHLETEVPPEGWDDDESIKTVLVFHISGVDVEGLTSGGQEEQASSEQEAQTGNGKRKITLKSLSAGLLLDEKSMAKSRIASSLAASPTASRSTRSESFSRSPYQASSPVATRSPPPESRSPSIDARSGPWPPSPQSSRHLPSMTASVMTTDADRFADAEDEEYARNTANMASSSTSENFGHQSMYGDESILQYGVDNGIFDENIEEGEENGPAHSQTSLKSLERTSADENQPHVVFSGSSSLPGRLPSPHGQLQVDEETPLVSRSQPIPEHARSEPSIEHHGTDVSLPEPVSPESTSTSDRSASASPSPASSIQNDLAESKLFSHEEAESMYMSAIDDGAAQSSRSFHMPGAWDTSSVSSNDSDRVPLASAPISLTPLDPIVERDDGCETPRPGSRAGTDSATGQEHLLDQDQIGLSTKVFTPLMDIDLISLWVPGNNTPRETAASDPLAYHDELPRSRVAFAEDSVFHDVPGSFSQYAASTARSRPSSSIMRESRRLPTQQPPMRHPGPPRRDESKRIEDEIEVSVGNVRLQIDVETIYLAMRLVKMLQQLFGDQHSVDTQKNPPKEAKTPQKDVDSKSQDWAFKFSMDTFQIALLKELSVQSIPANKPVGALRHAEWGDMSDVLLHLHIRNISAAGFKREDSSKITLKLGVFAFGFNDRTVLSFHPDTGLEETTVDLSDSQDDDVSITYSEDNGGPRIGISTLPVNVFLDVQKLDDTFASYGGFSGVLKIGNHIKSTCILPPATPVVSPKPRVAASETQAQSPMPKIDARFGGLHFTLQGETCGVLLQTSPARVNMRNGGLRAKIRHAKISGPHRTTSAVLSNNPPLSVEVQGIQLNYSFVPEEGDLSDLLSLITPTDFKYEADDDILIDTLLSQRRKGSLIKVSVQKSLRLSISDLESLKELESLGKDVAKLSSVAKLLPDDERPGILSMLDLATCNVDVMVNERIGKVAVECSKVRVAHIGLPALLALEIGQIFAQRNDAEMILDMVNVINDREVVIPTIMARWLGDEMEPTLKVKLFNLLFDYRVKTIMDVLGLSENSTSEEVALGMASSVATIKRAPSPGITRQSSAASEKSGPSSRPMNLDLLLRDCAIGLNPRKSQAKALVVLSDTRFTGSLVQEESMTASLDIRKASLLVIDDLRRTGQGEESNAKPPHAELGSLQVVNLCRLGFVSVGTTSKAKAVVKIAEPDGDGPRSVDVEFKNDLFVMESCADSTQTLMAIFGGLAPPQPPSKEVQYRTKVEPVLDMMASLAGDDFRSAPEQTSLGMDQSILVDDDDRDLHFMGEFYDPSKLPNLDDMTEEYIDESMFRSGQHAARGPSGDEGVYKLDFQEDFFGKASEERPAAQAWDSRKNEYIESSEVAIVKSPLTLRVKDVHFIWNLYDGYDWPTTREKLGQKLEEVQQRAQERRERLYDHEDDGISIEEDLLFGSVYIALPVNNTPEENRRQINHAMRGGDDTASETSYATTTASRATARPRSRNMRLKLERGRHHKITFELKGVFADVVVFPPGYGETQASVTVGVEKLEVIDHVPSSTWRKFVTYDQDAGERPLGSPMIRLELLNVRPVPNLAASELVVRVSVLPLRLHVDQDALDFITRFFEFKDDRLASKDAPGEQPFIQRLEVRTVHLKLDYKPKNVDYAGLRSGHTTEFMNFMVLDSANITLRRCIVYGISGFDKVHKTLNDIWMPDVKSNQIPSIIAGLAIARPIANVGSGIKSLITVPVTEYKKDGRIIRSAQKGIAAFTKQTTTEFLRLGARVSIGTQAMIQGAEGLLSPVSPPPGSSHGPQDDAAWQDLASPGSSPAEAPKAFSNYADQPIGVRAGLISARRHLQQDFATARDAIIAIPGEVMDSGSATGAARAVIRHAPVVMLRPLTGVAKGAGATLFGVANALDPESRRKIDDKYKRH